MPQKTLSALLGEVATHATKGEESFFHEIEVALHDLSMVIGREINADSTSILFVTEDQFAPLNPMMVMRGAQGNLKKIYDRHIGMWRSLFGKTPTGAIDDLRGFCYESRVDGYRDAPAQSVISRWSVTNQIWHLARGRIANSNRAMDLLQGGHQRSGLGDPVAYPGTNLATTFRSLVGVPIFAQGCPDRAFPESADDDGKLYPALASARAEFLAKYRVIGIIKAEGKRPVDLKMPDLPTVLQRLERLFTLRKALGLALSSEDQNELRDWCGSLYRLQTVDDRFQCKYSPLLIGDSVDACLLRKEIADLFGDLWHMHFTRRDMELLVLLAMQVGRLMARRVMKCAAEKNVILSENEVGLLNIRHRDIPAIVALHQAAEAAMAKVRYHMDTLKLELDFNKAQAVYHAQVTELLDAKGPIRDVSARQKDSLSLFRKLVHKHRHLQDLGSVFEISFGAVKATLEGHGSGNLGRTLMRGNVRAFINLSVPGHAEIDWRARLGPQDAAHLSLDLEKQPIMLQERDQAIDFEKPLVHRILNLYHVDDLAGVRILTDYSSNIDEILDEIRARAKSWQVCIDKVDDMREGKDDGYRAVHVTVRIDVAPLLPGDIVKVLREFLLLDEQKPLLIPVEVQLRTAYQHSWALKTHGIAYKREEQIGKELLDEHKILSNVLAQADWLSDIVKGGIENLLLPNDYGERRLLAFLKRRLSRDDINVVLFGIACAKELLKVRVRYNGLPEYSFAMEVCEQLVYDFREADSTLLLLALLQNVWRPETPAGHGEEYEVPLREKVDDADLIDLLCHRLHQECPTLLEHFRQRLPAMAPRNNEWLKDWLRSLPQWFWAMQSGFRHYSLQPLEDELAQWKNRLQSVHRDLRRRHKNNGSDPLDEKRWWEKAYLIEAAILRASLSELPFEPGRRRRRRLHDAYTSIFREIRKYLPNGPAKMRVIEELERAFRQCETDLDLPRRPEWWEA